MSRKREADNEAVVLRFYDELWNRWRLEVADELVGEGLHFRDRLEQPARGARTSSATSRVSELPSLTGTTASTRCSQPAIGRYAHDLGDTQELSRALGALPQVSTSG